MEGVVLGISLAGQFSCTRQQLWNLLIQQSDRWAAKEAAIKAVKPRRITMDEVEILEKRNGDILGVILERPASKWAIASRRGISFGRDEAGQDGKNASGSANLMDREHPLITKYEHGRSELDPEEPFDGRLLEGQIAKISISHDGEYATAVCLAVEEPALDDVGGEAAARDLGV
ncbi:hypothetical protein LTR04_004689 [Oleoguttula sp. CCFEE 6159]|nr:hypothetical protein LTR04_004689 [Oleoguttula sp. CCFEE 6159]